MKRLCQILGVARSSYYHWQATASTRAARQAADTVLARQIRAIHTADPTYGAPRITAELRDRHSFKVNALAPISRSELALTCDAVRCTRSAFVLILACPLMMVVMMRGLGGHADQDDTASSDRKTDDRHDATAGR